jgi:hypothetical protein
VTSTQLLLRVAGVLGGVILLEGIVSELYGYLVGIVGDATFPEVSSAGSAQQDLPFLPGILLSDLVYALGFSAGVFIALRFMRSILAETRWGALFRRAAFATFVGAIVIVIIRVVESLLDAFKIRPFPFGYAFTSSFVPNDFELGVLDTLGDGLNPFLVYSPLVVLVGVFLKLWLSGHWVRVRGVLS